MHYVKDIFEKRKTEHAHNKFVRYSKGEFVGPLLNIKVSKSSVKVDGSFHIANEILFLMAEYLGNKEVEIKGNLSWNEDLSPKLANIGIKYLKVTKSRGIFNYALHNKVKLKDFVENLGSYNLLVSFKADEAKLTTKNRLPKPNKEIAKDFVKAVFPAEMKDRILDEFAFDMKDRNAKQIDISHKIIVDRIHMPEVETFEEARRLATREGKIIREITLDAGEKVVTEQDFNV